MESLGDLQRRQQRQMCWDAPVTITSQPTNQTVLAGGTATFSVTAARHATLELSMEFQRDEHCGGTNTTLTLTNVQVSQAGNYAVLVTNLFGSILSSNAVLTVTLDHFAWGPIPSPRFVNTPFAVTIQAQDMTNGIFHQFHRHRHFGFHQRRCRHPAGFRQLCSRRMDRRGGDFPDGFEPGIAGRRRAGALRPRQSHQCHQPAQSGDVAFRQRALFMWPVGYSGFVLETSGNLSPATWVSVPYAPIQIGDQYLLPLDMTGTNGFYRLRFSAP